MERLRSKKDYELERDFVSKHTNSEAELIVDEETGRVAAAVYRCPINSFYKEHPNSDYAYSDMTDKIDKVIANGPDHPKALDNVKKIMDGTI